MVAENVAWLAAQRILRSPLSALLVLDRISGITGGVSAVALQRLIARGAMRRCGRPSIEAILCAPPPPVNAIFGAACYPERFIS